ncbi:MAG: hypothetical protein WD534_12175 [Phycisphaeraceae bacterium]
MGQVDSASQTITTAASVNAPSRLEQRNERLLLAAGTLDRLGNVMFNPELILAGLVLAVTGSATLAVLVSVIHRFALTIPQMFAGPLTEHRDTRRPAVAQLTAARGVTAVLLLIAIAWLGAEAGPAALVLFFVAYTAMVVASGMKVAVSTDLIGRSVAAGRSGRLFGQRLFLGGIASVIASFLVIQPLLGRLPLPVNYVSVGAIGTVVLVGSGLLMLRCHEFERSRSRQRTGVIESFRRGMRWVRRDRNYKRFVAVRACSRVTFVALALFLPYGQARFQISGAAAIAGMAGVMVGVRQGAELLSSIGWGRLADWLDYRYCMAGSGACFIGGVGLALAAPHLPVGFAIPMGVTETQLTLPLTVFLLALSLLAAGMQANIVSDLNFVMHNAPGRRRGTYFAFVSAATSPLALVPLLAAWLAEYAGYAIPLAIAAAAALGVIACAAGMDAPRHRQAS